MDISFSGILAWFKGIIQSALDWVYSLLKFIWDWIIARIVDGLITIVQSLDFQSETITAFTTGVSNVFGNAQLAYFVNILNIDIGLKLILGAYLARFILRRIPLIG